MKKLGLITKVKNEADIIEYFLRYHAQFFDSILVIDNGSIDGTYEIINSLIDEGLPIMLIDEAASEFDAYKFANKYTYNFVKSNNIDFLVLMDADEMLINIAGAGVREEIEKLSDDTIYYLLWRTYIYKNAPDRMFRVEDYPVYRDDTQEKFTKVIVPGKMVLEKKLIIAEGNHSAKVLGGSKEGKAENLRFAHFPIRGKNQYTKQIILNSINMLSYPDNGIQTGSHWKKMYDIMNDNVDLEQKSMSYAYYEGNETKEDKLSFDITTKYDNLVYDNLQGIMLRFSEIMALKLKSERLREVKPSTGKKRLLVYGTGGLCRKMLPRIDKEQYEIVSFVDSNREKQFQSFDNTIIISPDKMRFFKFDVIVIASEIYADEIRDNIKRLLPGFSDNKIVDIEPFVINQYINECE